MTPEEFANTMLVPKIKSGEDVSASVLTVRKAFSDNNWGEDEKVTIECAVEAALIDDAHI